MIAKLAAALALAALAGCGGGGDDQQEAAPAQLAEPVRVCVSDNPLHIYCRQEARQ